METSPTGSPDLQDFERLIEKNAEERRQLIERDWRLRNELREIVRKKLPNDRFEEVRNCEREARAEITRNLEQYDVLVEKWAAEATKQ